MAQFPKGRHPSFLESFAAGVEPAVESGTARKELDAAPVEKRRALLEEVVRGELSRVLGMSSAAAIEADQKLFDLGVDSLMATELRARLERQLAIALSVTLVFNHSTLRAICDHLQGELFGAAPPPEAPRDRLE